MRIQILANGRGGSVAMFQSSLSTFHNNINSTIDSLRATSSRISNLSGGPQNLSTSIEHINSRIQTEERKLVSVEQLGRRTDDFLRNTMATDARVSRQINQNREDVFREFPHLRPPCPPPPPVVERRSRWSRFWGSIGSGLSRAANWVWDNRRRILTTGLIIVGAALAIVAVVKTGGLALVPLLAKFGMGTAKAVTTSKIIGGVAVASTASSSAMNLANTWFEIESSAFHGIRNTLNVISGVTNVAYSIGTIFSAAKGISTRELNTMKKLRFTPDEIQTALKQNDVLRANGRHLMTMNDNAAGNFGEMLTDKAMRQEGFRRVSLDVKTDLTTGVGQRGIDGVFSNGSQFRIIETKTTVSSSTPSLLKNTTNDGRQMSSQWVHNRLAGSVSNEVLDDMVMRIGSGQQIPRVLSHVPRSSAVNGNVFNLTFTNIAEPSRNVMTLLGETAQTITVASPNFTLPAINLLLHPTSVAIPAFQGR